MKLLAEISTDLLKLVVICVRQEDAGLFSGGARPWLDADTNLCGSVLTEGSAKQCGVLAVKEGEVKRMLLRSAVLCCASETVIASAIYLLLEQSGLKSGQQSPVKDSGAVNINANTTNFAKNIFIIATVYFCP